MLTNSGIFKQKEERIYVKVIGVHVFGHSDVFQQIPNRHSDTNSEIDLLTAGD